MRRAPLLIVAALALSAPLRAQDEEGDAHRTAISATGGFSVGDSHLYSSGRIFDFHDSGSGFVAGGGIAHDLSPRLTIEANGLWLDRGTSAWSADAGFRLNLRPSKEGIVPYFGVSGGAYGEKAQVVSGVPIPVLPVPVYYPGHRDQPPYAVPRPPTSIVTTSVSRTDGMLTFGGGVRIGSGPHVFVRPDARAQVVFGGDTRVLGLFTLNFGYRF